MAGSKDFKLAFGVDVSELTSGLNEAKEAVVEAAATMKEALAQVSEAFGAIGEAAVAISAIMAGGAAFKEMVDATVNLNVSSAELGKQFGVSASQASVLKVALGETFLTQDQLSAAGSRLTRTLNTNEGAFKELGVATRDSGGNFRSTLDIMTDVNAKLLTFKEGTDRNIEGTKLYGKGWAEVADILRLTKPAMEEAQATATELNLVVTKEGEESTQRYRSAMAGLKDVFEGVRNTIGEALLPALSSIGEWFRDNGPQAIAVTRASLATIANVYITLKEQVLDFAAGLKGAFQEGAIDVAQFVVVTQNTFGILVDAFDLVKDSISGGVNVMIQSLLGFAKVSILALSGDFSGARAAWDAGTKSVVNAVNANMAKIKLDKNTLSVDWSAAKAAWKEGDDEIAGIDAQFVKTVEKNRRDAADAITAMQDNIFGDKSPTKGPAGSKTSDGGEDKGLAAKWEAELAQAKLAYEQEQLAQGTFQEFSKQQELEFWNEKLATHEAKGNQLVALDKRIADLQLSINKQAFDTEIAALKGQEAEYAKNAQVRVAIAAAEAQEIGQKYAFIGPQFEAAMKHLTDVEREAAQQQQQIADGAAKQIQDRQLEGIATDEKALQQRYSNHLISAQQLEQAEIQLEDRRTAILKAGIAARMALVDPTADPGQYSQLKDQLYAIDTQYQKKVDQLRLQSGKADQNLEKQGFSVIENSFNQTISRLIQGTTTFSSAMKSMMREIVTGIAQMLAQWAEKWAVTQILNLGATKVSNASSIASAAALAGALGVASWAGAPWPLDIGAPAFGAGMYADSIAYAASAAGGYDIPAGISPMTQLHQREMVLPAHLAEGIRGMVAAGGMGGGSTHYHDHAWQVNAMDGASIKRFVNGPGKDHIIDMLKGHFGNGRR